jgi:hypothetical protein
MAKSLEPSYTLFDSLEQMLTPKTLSELLSRSVTRVSCEPLTEHSGLAGGQLLYVHTNVGRFVLKRMRQESDWIMFASADTQCRAVRLWQYGLLDQLRPHLEHKTIACSRDNSGWAILMRDLTGHVYAWDKPMPPQLVPVFLDRLARLHATFWNDPCLNDPRLGLCDTAKLLDQTSLPMAQKHPNLSLGVIPEWVRGGWEVMEELLNPDTFAHLKDLIENPQPLFEALSRYPHTLLHGDYRAENLAYPDLPTALDWQEATCSLMTIDLAWFAKQGFIQDTMGQVQAITNYRGRLETYLNSCFDDTEWQAMIDLGTLVDTLRSTCFAAYWYKHSDTEDGRLWNELAVKQRNQQVRDALQWLEKLAAEDSAV